MMDICTKSHGNLHNSCSDISVKAKIVNLKMAIEEKSGDHQSQWASSSVDRECLYQISSQSVNNDIIVQDTMFFPVSRCSSAVMTDEVQLQARLIMLLTTLFLYEHFVTAREDKSAVSVNTKWTRTKGQQFIIF